MSPLKQYFTYDENGQYRGMFPFTSALYFCALYSVQALTIGKNPGLTSFLAICSFAATFESHFRLKNNNQFRDDKHITSMLNFAVIGASYINFQLTQDISMYVAVGALVLADTLAGALSKQEPNVPAR